MLSSSYFSEFANTACPVGRQTEVRSLRMLVMKSETDRIESQTSTHRKSKDRIFQALRADIISCRLIPGEGIRGDEITDRFGKSRTPIREMLRKLEQEDLVKIVPN